MKPSRSIAAFLSDHFRVPGDLASFNVIGRPSQRSGYFRLGRDFVCYAQCSSGSPAASPAERLHDAREHVLVDGSLIHLPFDPALAVENLRRERYHATGATVNPPNGLVPSVYYQVRPRLGASVRKHLQKLYFRGWEKIPFPQWPVDRTVEDTLEFLLALSVKSRGIEKVPFVWFWPEGARSCAMVTHDVETSAGRDYCDSLMDLDDSFAIKSSFQVVPEERYGVPQTLLDRIRDRGFELNVQDLNHDGLLFRERAEFLRRAERINQHAQRFGALGFRAAVLYRNPDWYDALKFSYDMSIPNVAHLDPQRGGCCTIFPFFIGEILELPVTLTQDYTLFHILNDYSIRLWQEQIRLIREKHGLISIIIHPDYILTDRPRRVFTDLMQYLCRLRDQGDAWIALPAEVAAWWRLRSRMTVVNNGSSWKVDGQGSERARLAYAIVAGDSVRYEISPG